MSDKEIWYVRSAEGAVYGPSDRETLAQWAREGRIDPSGFVSQDRLEWMPAQLMAELEMTWIVEAEPGKFFGPFNREVVIRLAADGQLPPGATVYRKHEYAPDEDPPPVIEEKIVEVPVEVEKIVEKIVEKEVRVEVPVEKIVEKIIEVEPPARTQIVDAEVVDAVGAQPPPPIFRGIFKGADRSRLEALEAAARRELSAAKRGGISAIGGIFGRRRG